MGCTESTVSKDAELDQVYQGALPPSTVVNAGPAEEAEQLTVQFTIPNGAVPGAEVQFTHEGRWCKVVIPEGSEPGQVLLVKVPQVKTRKSRQDVPSFATLHDAFKFLDPGGTGYITDHKKFQMVAEELAPALADSNEAFVWATLDQDGNGQVNWPEFVEWAENQKVELEVGMGDGQEGGISFPACWTGPRDDKDWIAQEEIEDSAHFLDLDDLVQKTYKKVWTRDRKATGVNKVPEGYELIKAKRCENRKDWQRYYLKRHQLVHACSTKTGFMQRPALTTRASGITRRQALRQNCNEWLLFHGTSREAAESILSGASDFVISLAGSATGTLYGKGTYFAESITKADEYAKADEKGHCCVLVCKVVGGHVLYNDEVTPDPDQLQQSCISGDFHSVLGDREKCRNTFKEYVVFDADQVYVEYVLFYKRIYDR
eukprot:TRINITY_DN78601_c0_g1_i1.p1 TRINITY_DN78601_c0_g1~~TRINITY_DN78601_c0_g1_i1.p1  ORF type:complete len:431 (-),score=96.48 TRINITY_DN78601_c0_g1_i1:50-1342(-)